MSLRRPSRPVPPGPITTANGHTWEAVRDAQQAHRASTLALVSPALPQAVLDFTFPPSEDTSVEKQRRLAHLTTDEIGITESSVESLRERLAKGELSATVVVGAFLRRAAVAQGLTNCLTELLPKCALARAKYLDDEFAKTGKPVGPLHGIPISVKEHIGMAGLDLNAGFVAWVGRDPPTQDAHILRILWDAGALFYARTTQPQSLMHLETSNNLFGVTVNPFNTSLTAGGSSGGEGALLGSRGSCLGIGSDIGGSIRSPAANNGVYGMKPTTLRLPTQGWSATMAGSEQIVPVIGPLSTSLEGIRIFMKTLIDAKPWLTEPSLLPFPWKEEDLFGGKKLRVAVLWDDGVVKPHPPVTRALEKVVEKLKENKDIEILEWTPYEHNMAWNIISNLYFSDGAAEEIEAINASHEPWRPLTEHIIRNPNVIPHTISSMWQAIARRDTYRAEYAAKWNATATAAGGPDTQVDVILSPAGPSAAPKLDTARWWGYTSQWNLLDYPALVFPVDRVDVALDAQQDKQPYKPRNEWDRYNWALWEEYGAEGWRDAPLSLQLIGRRYEDERVLQAYELIQKATELPFVKYT